GEHLKMPRPDVAWFELSYADGKPPEAALKTALRVDNRPGLVAPAWKIQLTNWDRNAGKDAIRRPVVTASWIEGFPGTAGTFAVDLQNPGRTADIGPITADGLPVELVTRPSIEKGLAKDMPEGDYLTIRFSYKDRTKPVFLRPGKLKGTDQKFKLYERHMYYEFLG